MTAVLRGAGAVVVHDDQTFSFGPGALPDDTPAEVIAILRRRGALVSHAPDPDDGPSPDPTEPPTDPADLAEYIDAHDLNAPATVALAGGTAEGARRVLEAERLSSGGDGRKTVVEPLERLIEQDAG